MCMLTEPRDQTHMTTPSLCSLTSRLNEQTNWYSSKKDDSITDRMTFRKELIILLLGCQKARERASSTGQLCVQG